MALGRSCQHRSGQLSSDGSVALAAASPCLWLRKVLIHVVPCESMQVMVEVKALTKINITVVATVHSPTPYCFTLCDRLMIILSGRIVYSGERGDHYAHLSSPAYTPVSRRASHASTVLRHCFSPAAELV